MTTFDQAAVIRAGEQAYRMGTPRESNPYRRLPSACGGERSRQMWWWGFDKEAIEHPIASRPVAWIWQAHA